MISGLKYVNAGALVGLCLLVYKTHKKIWQFDMARKHGASRARVNELPATAERYIVPEQCTN
jgi:hypothetical protein